AQSVDPCVGKVGQAAAPEGCGAQQPSVAAPPPAAEVVQSNYQQAPAGSQSQAQQSAPEPDYQEGAAAGNQDYENQPSQSAGETGGYAQRQLRH
ncbi:unnamed protein product, partial [Enterobius vermicularis]|uniref:Adenylate cyclase n=1 Tax=Enterobius vermicularis TaxID=51028 RepID=A0A0N4VB22_ENTVE